MYSTEIKPDFKKLHRYVPEMSDEQIYLLKHSDGVPVHLQYLSEAGYKRLTDGLKIIVRRYDIGDHYNELLYIILQKNEQIRERYDAYWQNYNDDMTTREVASFLLAYKLSKPSQLFQLVAKPITGSVAIKDSVIARWMCEQLYNAIESRNFPLGVFGEKILYDLFGDEWSSDTPLDIERLKAASNIKPYKPTKRVKKLLVEFCIHIQIYLIEETELKAPEHVLLTDAQANFFFDVLELIGYLDRETIQSEPKDYIHTMFRNHVRIKD